MFDTPLARQTAEISLQFLEQNPVLQLFSGIVRQDFSQHFLALMTAFMLKLQKAKECL